MKIYEVKFVFFTSYIMKKASNKSRENFFMRSIYVKSKLWFI